MQTAAHSQDISLLNASLKNVTRRNCLRKLRDLGIRSKLEALIQQLLVVGGILYVQ